MTFFSSFRIAEQLSASSFAALNLDSVYCAYTLYQAGANYLQRTDPHIAKDTHRLNSVFIALDMIWLTWSAGKLLRALPFSTASSTIQTGNWTAPDWSYRHVAIFNGMAITTLGVALCAALLINHKMAAIYAPKENLRDLVPQEKRDTIHFEWTQPAIQHVARTLCVLKGIVTLASVIFAENRLFSIATFAGLAFSTYETSRLPWLKISQSLDANRTIETQLPSGETTTFNQFEHSGISKIEWNYWSLLTPYKGQDRDCVIPYCEKSGEEPADTVLCSNRHRLHYEDVVGLLCGNEDELSHHLLNQPIQRTRQRKDNGDSYYTYSIAIPEAKYPKCPTCRKVPSHSYLQIRGWESGGTHATYDWKGIRTELTRGPHDLPLAPPSYFWPSTEYLYTAFQVYLVFMPYFRPHLGATLCKLQQFMLMTDLILLGAKLHNYFQFSLDRTKEGPLLAAIAISAIAAVALSIYHYKASKINQASILKGVIPENDLKNITLNWNTPFSIRMIQWVFVTRLAFNLALAKVSPHDRNWHLSSALVQGFLLYKISTLAWLHFEHKMHAPLIDKAIRYFNAYTHTEYGANDVLGFKSNLLSAKLNLYFILPDKNTLLPNQEALYAAAKAIYDYTSSCFENSFWKAFSSSNRGVRAHHFLVQITPQKLIVSGIDLSQRLWVGIGQAVSKIRGSGNLHLSFQH